MRQFTLEYIIRDGEYEYWQKETYAAETSEEALSDWMAANDLQPAEGEKPGTYESPGDYRLFVLMVIAPTHDYQTVLRRLIEAAEALADQEEATLSLDETKGNQKKVLPANMFLSVGRSDIRKAIADARRLLEGD